MAFVWLRYRFSTIFLWYRSSLTREGARNRREFQVCHTRGVWENRDHVASFHLEEVSTWHGDCWLWDSSWLTPCDLAILHFFINIYYKLLRHQNQCLLKGRVVQHCVHATKHLQLRFLQAHVEVLWTCKVLHQLLISSSLTGSPRPPWTGHWSTCTELYEQEDHLPKWQSQVWYLWFSGYIRIVHHENQLVDITTFFPCHRWCAHVDLIV